MLSLTLTYVGSERPPQRGAARPEAGRLDHRMVLTELGIGMVLAVGARRARQTTKKKKKGRDGLRPRSSQERMGNA